MLEIHSLPVTSTKFVLKPGCFYNFSNLFAQVNFEIFCKQKVRVVWRWSDEKIKVDDASNSNDYLPIVFGLYVYSKFTTVSYVT